MTNSTHEDSTNQSNSNPVETGAAEEERKFHGWRLLGIIFLVIVGIAIVSAIVDWLVIGPLEGRVF